MYEEICSKTHEYKHRDKHNSIRTPRHTCQTYKLCFTPLWTDSTCIFWCEQRWVLITYPPKTRCNFQVFTSNKSESSLCVLICDHISTACVSVCLYALQSQSDVVGVTTHCLSLWVHFPHGSYESAHVLDVLSLVYHACVPHRVGEMSLYKSMCIG